MGKYDTGSKQVIHHYNQAWSEWVLQNEQIEIEEELSGEFRFIARSNDSLLKVIGKDGPFLSLTELQFVYDATMPERLVAYKLLAYQINHLVDEGVGVLVIGRNKGWKQSINIGKANNQSFVQFPFAQFIQMLTYKAKLVGIQVRLQEESYTSKCSFLDDEPIQKQTRYQGQRIKRGLFRTATGRLINADVNGSYNIIKKAIPEAFLVDGIEDIAVHPLRLTPA